MTMTPFQLSSGNLVQDWSGTAAALTTDNWNNIPSIVGYRGDGLTSSTATDPQTNVAPGDGTPINLIDNSTPGSSTGGVHEITDTVVALQGSGTADAPHLVFYLNTTGVTDVRVQYLLQELDASTTDQKFALQYRIGSTGNFINVPLGAVNGVFQAAGNQSASVNVLLPSAVNNQPLVQVRVITNDAPGSDAMVGIDNIVISSTSGGGGTPSLSISDATVTEGNSGTTTLTYTVTASAPAPAGGITFNIATTGGTATAGTDFVANSVTGAAIAEGQTTYTFSVTVNGDIEVEPNETVIVTVSGATGATIADGEGVGTITNDDSAPATLTLISAIQGNSYFSPILAAAGVTTFNTASSTTVTVRAVVTAVDNVGSRQGFFISEEVSDWDNNRFTSEGIFVFTGATVSGVAVGDLVTVSANVLEYQANNNLPVTTLVNPTGLTVTATNQALPVFTLGTNHPIPNSILTAVTPNYLDSVDDAGDTFDADRYALSYYETVEGMLVTVPDLVVADGFVSTSGGRPFFKAYSTVHADADQINSRGGYTIAGDPPLSPPDTPEDADDNTIFGGRHLHDGDANPDIIEVDFTGFAIAPPAGLATGASMGDPLGDVTGIIDFDFREVKLFVTALEVGGFVDNQPSQETTTLAADPRSLTVASFNVENLDPTDGQARFDAIADSILNNLKLPDILTLEEVQDNNGAAAGDGVNPTGTDASTTFQTLVNSLNAKAAAAGSTAVYQWVDELPVYNQEGGQQSGNIRVGFLYNTTRVQLGDLPANASIAERRQFTDRIGDNVRDAGDRIQYSDNQAAGVNPADWAGTRKSLLGEFTFNGVKTFVAGSHFPSKGGSGEFWQFDQTLEAGQPANADWAQRNAVGEDLYSVLNLVQTGSPLAGIVAGGDYNDFYFYRPLETATGYLFADGTVRNDGPRLDNLTLRLAEAERYTFDFDGRSQAIDHILANPLFSNLAQYDIVHLNTGFNASNSPALSDHEPLISRFDLRSLSETLTGTAGNDTIDGEGGDDLLLLGQGGTETVRGGAGDDGFFFGTTFDPSDSVDGGAGAGDQVGLQGDYTITLSANSLVNVETLALMGAGETRFGITGGTGDNDYTITTVDENVPDGGNLIVNANGLRNDETQGREDLIFNGQAESNGSFTIFAGFGNDQLNGGQRSDGFLFGENDRFTADDRINGTSGTDDQLGLRGTYNVVLQDATIQNIDTIALISSTDPRFGAMSPPFTFNITTANGNVANGARLVLNGSGLLASEVVTFSGAAETDGSFDLRGGAANDNLTGGALADRLFGGDGGDQLDGRGGADTYLYLALTDSDPAAPDSVQFDGSDIFDFSNIDANANVDGNQAFDFIEMDAFSAAGQVRVGSDANGRFLEADVNGDGAADFVIRLGGDTTLPITDANFVL